MEMDQVTTTMRANAQALDENPESRWLYRSGYRSSTVDTTIDKLLTMEGARAQRVCLTWRAVAAFKGSISFHRTDSSGVLRACEMGDSADMFEVERLMPDASPFGERLDSCAVGRRDEGAPNVDGMVPSPVWL